MKNLETNMFEINKTTMRDMTPYEINKVAGGAEENLASGATTIGTTSLIIISIIRDPDC